MARYSNVRLSLIIPAYNEAKLLPRLLNTISTAREAYRDGPENIDVIVADNGSTDATVQIAREWGARTVTVTMRAIGAVRNGGAKAATGEVVCFIDADMQIHPDSFNQIAAAMDSGRYICGATGVTLETWSLGLAVTYAVLVPVIWVLRLDTGIVFTGKEDFERVDGYPEDRLFGEDVAFLLRMRRLGRSLRPRKRLTRLRTCKAIASTRKFHEHGQWHYFVAAFRWVLAAVGIGTEKAIADKYWYDVDR